MKDWWIRRDGDFICTGRSKIDFFNTEFNPISAESQKNKYYFPHANVPGEKINI